MTEPIIRAQQVEKYYAQPSENADPGDRADRSVDCAGGDRRAAGPVGIRKIDAAAHAGGAVAPLGGRGATGMASRSPPVDGNQCLHCLSELRAFSVAHGAGKCGGTPEGGGDGGAEAARAQSEDSGHGRSGRFQAAYPEGTFGRDAAARGICAGTGGGAGSAVHGRAILGARRADGREPAQ